MHPQTPASGGRDQTPPLANDLGREGVQMPVGSVGLSVEPSVPSDGFDCLWLHLDGQRIGTIYGPQSADHARFVKCAIECHSKLVDALDLIDRQSIATTDQNYLAINSRVMRAVSAALALARPTSGAVALAGDPVRAASPVLLAALIKVKHGAEYPDELGDIINAAIALAGGENGP